MSCKITTCHLTSHDLCLVHEASDGVHAVEEDGICEDRVRKGNDCSKEGQRMSNPFLRGVTADVSIVHWEIVNMKSQDDLWVNG